MNDRADDGEEDGGGGNHEKHSIGYAALLALVVLICRDGYGDADGYAVAGSAGDDVVMVLNTVTVVTTTTTTTTTTTNTTTTPSPSLHDLPISVIIVSIFIITLAIITIIAPSSW